MISDLLDHYEEKERPEAMTGLLRSLREAWAKIEADPSAGLSSPRPYPTVVRPTWSWVKAGAYWIAYRQRPTLAITAIFYETANIPKRL